MDFIELEAAGNLTICDVRSEVSCQEEDRSRDPLLGLQLGSREARGIPQTPAPIPRRVTLVLPEEAPGTVILPPRGVRIQQIPLFQKVPPLPLPPWPSRGRSRTVRCPRGLASHKHFASPPWPPEERQGLVLQAGSRRAYGLKFQAGFRFHSGLFPDLPRPPSSSASDGSL